MRLNDMKGVQYVIVIRVVDTLFVDMSQTALRSVARGWGL